MGVGRVAPRCLPVAARSRRPGERSVTGRGEFREGSREGSQRRWFDPSGRAPPRPACGLLGEFDSTPVPAKPPRFVMNVTSPRTRSSTASCARTSSRSSNAPDRRALRSPASSSGRSGPISSAGSSLTASCVFTATSAATIGSSRFHAKGVAFVHPVAVVAWRTLPLISSIGSSPRCPSASGCSRFRIRSDIAVRGTRGSRARCCVASCARFSPTTDAAQSATSVCGVGRADRSRSSSASVPR